MGVVAALAFCRLGQDAAALMLWGASAYLWLLVPRRLATGVAARLRPWRTAAVAVAAVATIARLPAEAAAIGSGWRDAADPAMLRQVMVATSAGLSWQVQALAAPLLVAAAILPPRGRLVLSAMASGLMLAALSLTGHAVMQDGALGVLHRANDVLHVLAAGAWLGALAPVLVILRVLGSPETRHDATLALRRFSRAGHGAVAVVLLSGVANAALTLGRWPVDLASPYVLLLDVKIACVAGMTVLALLNRYIVVPRIARDASALRALRYGTLAELPLGVAAIALVSVFGLLDPA